MHPVTLLLLSTRTHTTAINTIHNTPVVETIFFCCTCITIFIAQLYNASVTVESFFLSSTLKKKQKFKCMHAAIWESKLDKITVTAKLKILLDSRN